MANPYLNQFHWSYHGFLVELDCRFTIASSDSAGLGQINLTGRGISQVYCHSSSPAAGNLVPSGYIQVFFLENYYRHFFGTQDIRTPLSGSNINISSGLTSGSVYVITSVGTSTTANWQAVGLPLGITPAVGVTFIASTSSPGTGTGVVQVPTTNGSGISSIEIVGDPNTTLKANTPGIPTANGYIMLRCMAGGTPIVTQPADGTRIGCAFYLSNTSRLINGS